MDLAAQVATVEAVPRVAVIPFPPPVFRIPKNDASRRSARLNPPAAADRPTDQETA
jgi:hypothetical protein